MNTTVTVETATRATTATSPESSDGLGPYRLDKLVAENATGTVFSATHRQMKRKATVIVLPAFDQHDPNCIAEFSREMATIGEFKHPNVVTVNDAGEDQGLHYIAMDYIDGIDLQTILQQDQKLSPKTACEIIRQAAIGMHQLHSQDILHRGMKPSNLMISQDGIVKIVGMGVAALQGSDLAAQEKETLPSSANYLAPEQFRGEQETRSDIFGLGCVLYRMITGQLPPLAMDEEQKSVMSLSNLAPDMSPELGAVIRQMMAKNPAHRFQNFNQVVAAMCNWASGEEIKELVAKNLEPIVLGDASLAAARNSPAEADPVDDGYDSEVVTAAAEPYYADETEASVHQAEQLDAGKRGITWPIPVILSAGLIGGLAYGAILFTTGATTPRSAESTAPSTDLASAANDESTVVVDAPQPVADDYHLAVEQQLHDEYGLAGGRWVLPTEELVLANMAVTYGHTARLAPSYDQDFQQAIRMEVNNPGENPWDAGLYLPDVEGVKAGDCVVMVVWLRTTESSAAPVGRVSVFAEDASTDTKEVYTTLSPMEHWQRYFIPFKAKSDATLRVGFHLAHQMQELEYAGFTLINYGNAVPHWESTAAKMNASSL